MVWRDAKRRPVRRLIVCSVRIQVGGCSNGRIGDGTENRRLGLRDVRVDVRSQPDARNEFCRQRLWLRERSRRVRGRRAQASVREYGSDRLFW